MSKFSHLHVHSHYSLLNALPQIPDLVKKAKELGMTSLGLTDNGNLYGAIEFYRACQKQEIKPIIGIDAYVAARTRFDKEHGIDNRRTRLVFLAKDQSGYKSLIKLVTLSHLDGFYYKPRIDRELIEQSKEGLICIMPAMGGAVPQILKTGDTKKALDLLSYYKSVFGDDFYQELTAHPEIPGHDTFMDEIASLAKKAGVQIMAAHDVYYLNPEDRRARQTLLSVQTSGDPSERFSEEEEDFSLVAPEEIEARFTRFPEALSNTQKIADSCNLELTLGEWYFPNYIVESNRSHDDELKHLVYEGLASRHVELTDTVKKRIEYELKVIRDKGYAPYFLVVGDLLRHAHEHGILTTIRGSVAGSLVTYLAHITNVNPLEYKLPFERFLNPERPSAPDIDMDFADNRRDEVIEYARNKYGADKVAQIGTFGTMMARGAVRDTTRALGYPHALGDRVAKLIPMGSQGFPMTIEKALELVPELLDIYKKEPEVREIIDMAKKIEGCARHISVHAAGVVISPIPLIEMVPVQYDTKGEGKIITQYDMHAVGEDNTGLLKFDFLGIRNLAILADAVALVKRLEGKIIDIERIPLDDKKTFDLLAKGETIGLFQLNGTGMTRFLKELRPSRIQDINAMVALYRPGPMESIPQYIERKHNPNLIQYLDPRLNDILDQSYGVITYQDDVMMISIKLAGYSWLEADKLRKAMGKKIPAEMEAQKEKLLKGFVEHGLSEAKSMELWKLIEPFAAYGFNKAHAASYGRVAYQTAYMKANFPAIYMSAVLTAESGDIEKTAEIVAECKRMHIPVLPPDINESFANFTALKSEGQDTYDTIRFGLSSIKNFGEGIAQTIIGERKQNGKFKSLSDFLQRIKDRNLNKKSLEALIKTGALDAMGERGHLLYNLDKILAYNKEKMREDENQNSLFSGTEMVNDVVLEACAPASRDERLAWEKDLLGLYVSGHPLDKYKEKLTEIGASINRTKNELLEGMTAKVYGILEDIRPILTKKGDKMAFLKVADTEGNIEVVVFPKTFKEYESIITPDNCVGIKGRISKRNGGISVIVEKMKVL